jgi:hypothetical protein
MSPACSPRPHPRRRRCLDSDVVLVNSVDNIVLLDGPDNRQAVGAIVPGASDNSGGTGESGSQVNDFPAYRRDRAKLETRVDKSVFGGSTHRWSGC